MTDRGKTGVNRLIDDAIQAEREIAATICERPWKHLATGKTWPFDRDQTAFINEIMKIRAEEIREDK